MKKNILLLVVIAVLFGCNKKDTTKTDTNSVSESSLKQDEGIYSSDNISNSKYDYVDLGLPSGTLWATTNVGADKPEDYGDYFAWGETTPKSSYDWSNYKWCRGSDKTMTKYCSDSDHGSVDNKMELELSDDAAYVNMGSGWRMPTREQQDELRENCKWTWKKRNGVNGYEVSHNGKSIFLPAAGAHLRGLVDGIGTHGAYWSRTLDTCISDGAYHVIFTSGYVGLFDIYRDGGRSVRAVRSSN